MNKELAELMELLNERAKAEQDFEQSVAKLDARIAVLVAKVNAKAEPKPVEVEGYTREKPRKTRSDKGKVRRPTVDLPDADELPEGFDPDIPIGEVVGQLKD